NIRLAKGDFDHAIVALERGLSDDPSEQIARAWPFVASALGAAYVQVGRLGDGVPMLEQAVERAAVMKLRANHSLRLPRVPEAQRLGGVGEGQVIGGRAETAFTIARQALDLAQEHRELGHEAHVHRALASVEVERAAPALDHAEESYKTALALAVELGMRPLE